MLTQRYHFHDTAQGGARDALVLRTRLDAPVPRYSAKLAVEFKSQADRQIRIIGTITAEAIPASNDPAIRVTAWLDGERGAARETHASPGAEPSRGIASETFEVDLNAADLPPGRHYVTVRFESVAEQVHIESEVADGPTPLANEQAVTFELADPAGRYAAVSYQGGAGVKTRLIEVDRDNGAPLLIFGDTAGVVTALDASTMQPRWQYATASEILHALTRVGPHIVAGDTDGNLHVLDARTGAQLHKLSDFAPVFGAGLVVDGALYFGDANGWLHAVDTTTWAKIWSRDVAQFAFESPPVHDSQNDRLLLGSWDGFYYSVSRAAGEVQWKAWNTQGQVAAKSRYYGPADSAPVVVGDEMWGADRGYRLGRYRLIDGEFLGEVHSQVAAIAPVGGPTDAAGEGVVARGQDNRLIRFRPDGSIAWETEAPLGRCPIPPTVAAPPAGRRGNIAAVSDRGLLTLVDAESGEPQLQWSLTPQLFVLAPVTASSDGKAWFAAGMDGVVTRISAVND